VHFRPFRRILATYRAISGQKRGIFVSNHAHRIRRKPRFWGTIMENRRCEQHERKMDRRARAYFVRRAAAMTFLATWDTPLDAAPQTAIQSVMDYAKKHSVPVEEYYASKRLVYDRNGKCLGMFDVADLEVTPEAQLAAEIADGRLELSGEYHAN
jgi:hypothetical protein